MNPDPADQKITRVHLAWLLGAVIAAYAWSLGFDFAWDDRSLIVNNPLLRRPGLLEMFTRTFWDTGRMRDAFNVFYRPIVTLSYGLNLRWFGAGPFSFHLLNLLLHLANTVLVLWLARRFFRNAAWAFVAAVVFALHPVHVENVAWISGRTDLLAGCFGLASLMGWLHAEERSSRPWMLFGTACYFLALLSKEVSVIFPLALLLFPLPGRDRDAPGFWSLARMQICLTAGAALVMYGLLRFQALGSRIHGIFIPGWADNLSALGLVLASYLRLSLRVFGFAPQYDDLRADMLHGPLFWAGLVLLLLEAAGLVWIGRRRRAWTRVIWLWLIFLLPVLTLQGFGGTLYADRYLYLPGLGLGFAAVLLAQALYRRWLSRREETLAAGRITGGLGAILLAATVAASAIWRDDVTLFTRAVRAAPHAATAWNNLGLSWSTRNYLTEAEGCFRQAVKLKPDYSHARHNLAVVLRKQQRFPDARAEFDTAIRQEPSNALYTFTLAEMLAAQGQAREAETWYRKTLELKDHYLEARHNLGELLMSQDRLDEAREEFIRVIAAHPRPVMSLNSLGIIEARSGRLDAARSCFEKALRLDPQFEPARQNLQRLPPVPAGGGKPGSKGP